MGSSLGQKLVLALHDTASGRCCQPCYHADTPWLLLQEGQHTTADEAAALMAAADADVQEGQALEVALTAEDEIHSETEVKLILLQSPALLALLPFAAAIQE